MEKCLKLFLIINCIFRCNGVSWRRQLEHIARRFYQFDPREMSSILGLPSRASHLPEAEPILPGHTLLKPSLGMLKSAVKFPHKEMEDGAGVYGNIDNLGIRYDGRNERTLYSGFRRTPADYFMVVPLNGKDTQGRPRFKLESAVLDLERKENAKNKLLKILKRLDIPLKGLKVFVASLNKYDSNDLNNKKRTSYYLNGDEKSYNLKTKEMYLRNKKENDNRSDQSIASKERGISNENITQRNSEELEKIKKIEWFKQSKNSYDHIKVNQDAPEYNELLPANDEKIRKWWFYNSCERIAETTLARSPYVSPDETRVI
ncbi:uncharacterized protein LOC126773438 isoform X2 [Nymphalis io]|uniref:uncharacterized protein LOC126773438 isoform X2 n=1 Tax=Inachis io TaxID=171585 RepID=UPI0021670F79|nr:uncharacterized protein LOC126773438 isoform X2 [Nymphalis io]